MCADSPQEGRSGSAAASSGPSARTSFESHELNALIDLVENSNPADLEVTGSALMKAQEDLEIAARELEGYIDQVHWEGVSGTEFRRFGKGLARYAETLGSYAARTGTEIQAAGAGLASVRSSMPPRDTRLAKKTPEDIALPERTEANPAYADAVKTERDRQEAINQVNRLASYYAVSGDTLAANEPPTFDTMLKADVPPPARRHDPEPSQSATGAGAVLPRQPTPQSAPASTDYGVTGGTTWGDDLGSVTRLPDRSTSMEIDSVATPPAPSTAPNTAPVPVANSGPSTPSGPVPPMTSGLPTPVRGGTPRPTGASSTPRVSGPGAATVGRPGVSGNGPATAGRPGVIGRPGPVGNGPVTPGRAGTVGSAGTAGQTPPAGRPGTTGPSTVGRTGTTPPNNIPTGRAGGIVGGTPQRAAPGAAGSRLPRGTVIGSEGTAPGRNSTGRGSHPGAPSPNGVVGTPRSNTSGSRPGAGSFTQGGAGLVRGPATGRPSEHEERERTVAQRPDYLTEDEETWAARRRGAVPPVVE